MLIVFHVNKDMFKVIAASTRRRSLFVHIAYVPTLLTLEEKMLLSMSLFVLQLIP